MCEKKSCCPNPEKLKGEPEDCSQEQISECHPESKGHPCEGEEEENKE